MKTQQFKILLRAMNTKQQSALEELEKEHSELIWDGGKVDTRPLRVSIKNRGGKSMAAINTREKDIFLRLEFRSKDYNGTYGISTRHRSFDKAFDLFAGSNIATASEIISSIKKNYTESNKTPTVEIKKEEYNKPNEETYLHCKEKNAIISVMGPHAGESESEIFKRKIDDIKKIGVTFWLMRSIQAKPLMVQSICRKAKKNNLFAIFIEASSSGRGAIPTLSDHAAASYSSDGINWENLPKGLSPVTGKIDNRSYALIFDKLELSKGRIDLWDYADFFNPDSPIRIFQGGSTLCAVKKNVSKKTNKIKSRYRKIIALGRLCPPFGVWLK